MSIRKSKRWNKTDAKKATKPERKHKVAPMCKLCRTRHWEYQAHQFTDTSL